ncbi:MAG: M55 family metallopeptidase [Woeseia sp.]
MSTTATAADGLKIYISADMEGLAGVVSGDQLRPGGFEYERFRRILTGEVNACIAAARSKGATEFVISDSHGNGQNLLIEELPEDVTIVRGHPRPLAMMQGIDSSFDAAIFIGYHASASSTTGVRAHTMSSANITDVRLNGIPISEGIMNAAMAGHFGVPVILMTGDDAAIAETTSVIGDINTATVKWASGFHSARTLTPQAARALIAEQTSAALDRLDEFSVYTLKQPVSLRLTLKHYQPVELLSYLPGIDRVDSHTIAYVGDDLPDISRLLRVILEYRVDAQP